MLIDIALVEREVDRARRAFGMFFEVFGQRGTTFAPVLAAHDVIANDCYDAVRQGAPRLLDRKALAPISYMEHGYSPATMRRGTVLARLLGEANPFPVIRIPWDRDNPWQPVFLHEVAHNLQADMGIWQENRTRRRQAGAHRDRRSAAQRHLWPLAQGDLRRSGGPAAGRPRRGVGHGAVPGAPGAARADLSARRRSPDRLPARADPGRDAAPHGLRRRGGTAGTGLAHASTTHAASIACRRGCLSSAGTLLPHVVDEIAFQTRRNLAHRALADVIRFRREDEEAIQAARGG